MLTVFNRNLFSRTALLASLSWIATLCLITAPLSADEAALPPNIILLVADDLGYGEIGGEREGQIPAPHLDRMAAEGVRLTNGYVTASFCAPSRAGLMSGRYQTRFGYELNPVGADNEDPRVGIPGTETTLPQALHQQGYATALIGKWHLGGTAAQQPLRRGFEEFFGFLHEGHYFVPTPYREVYTILRHRHPPGGGPRWIRDDGLFILSTHTGTFEPPYDANNPLLRGSQPILEEAYLTDAFTREAVSFIQRNRSRPFFLMLAYNAVHSPMQAKRADVDRFGEIDDIHRRIFAGMLHALDESIGAVRAAVDEAGLTERTLIVFLSDNGGPTRELTSSNLPMRGGKGEMYEGGLRIPFQICWPGTIPGGRIVDDPVISLDLFPTALSAAGISTQGLRQPLDGIDLLPRLKDAAGPAPERELYWRMGPKAAFRHGDWKLVRPGAPRRPEAWELYDLGTDPGETQDLASQEPETLQELIKRWQRLDQQMIPPVWTR